MRRRGRRGGSEEWVCLRVFFLSWVVWDRIGFTGCLFFDYFLYCFPPSLYYFFIPDSVLGLRYHGS